jgi:uncharacterized protein YfdQ (DUF2303 family)
MNEISDDTRDIAAAVQAGRESAEVAGRITTHILEGVPVPVVVNGTGVRVASDVLQEVDRRRDQPARRVGTTVLDEVDSFIAYVNRFSKPDTTIIYAHQKTRTVTAVFDEHTPGPDPRAAHWRQHRATYRCPLSPEWEKWSKVHGAKLSQTGFADFIDANMLDITSGNGYPTPGELLQMARNLQVTVGHRFKRVIDKATGTGTLIDETEHDASSTKIPRAFGLGIRVFEGGELHAVEARLYFAMTENVPSFSVELYRKEEHEREAFAEVHKAVSTATGCLVLAGEAGAA